MKVITVNTNGIRAAARKGFFDWLKTQNADVVCIQETKAQVDQLSDPIFHPEGYHCYYFDAIKKGYSGTAIYSRVKPNKITKGLGWDPADSEGRGGRHYARHAARRGDARRTQEGGRVAPPPLAAHRRIRDETRSAHAADPDARRSALAAALRGRELQGAHEALPAADQQRPQR